MDRGMNQNNLLLFGAGGGNGRGGNQNSNNNSNNSNNNNNNSSNFNESGSAAGGQQDQQEGGGFSGFPAGGLLQQYLQQQQQLQQLQQQLGQQQQQQKQQQNDEQNLSNPFVGGNNLASMNAAMGGAGLPSSMMGGAAGLGGMAGMTGLAGLGGAAAGMGLGGIGGSGAMGDLGGLSSFANAGGVTSSMNPFSGLGSHTAGMVSSGLANQSPEASPNEVNSLDANRLLLQRLQGANKPASQSNTWIGDMSGEGDPYAENGILGPWSATSAGLLGNMVATSQDKEKKIKKKPKDKPKRPLSAYNIFFKEERNRILEALPEGDPKPENAGGRKRKKKPHGKIGFESLAKVIGQRWQELTADQVDYYKKKAEADMLRYKSEMEKYVTSNNEVNKGKDVDDFDGGADPLAGGVDTALAGVEAFQQQLAKRQRFEGSGF